MARQMSEAESKL